ncbi:glycerol-3-phosphate acyltransferase [Chloroflexota bacterium]
MNFTGVIAVIIAYLLGAIPSAYIITRLLTGKDIRELGQGHVGGGNVLREIGLWPAIIVAVSDISKGVLAVFIAHNLMGIPIYHPQILQNTSEPYFYILASGLAAIIGHKWSIYIKFNGGHGLATALGIVLALMWIEFLIAVVVAIVLRSVTRNSGLAVYIGLGFAAPISAWFIEKSLLSVIIPFSLAIISAIYFHPYSKSTPNRRS